MRGFTLGRILFFGAALAFPNVAVAVPPVAKVPAIPAAPPPPSEPAIPVTPPDPVLPELDLDHAVAIALARNRDVIAAKLEIREAELDQVEARVYPNPTLSYTAGNLVLGAGNTANASAGAPRDPGFFSQVVHTIGVSDIIDIWSKRGARMHAADQGLAYKRLTVEDALREIVYGVRSAFADVVREQSERDLSRETRDRYAETVRLSRIRYSTGEISSAELGKTELEGLKYETAVIDAEQQFDLAREKLAALLGLGTELPFHASFPLPQEFTVSIPDLTKEALARRPDVLAVMASRQFATAQLSAAKREALPDISLGVSYTHSGFTVSGDNPNSLALSLAAPLPLFDRNQANIGRAELAIRRSENDAARLELQVRLEVADAARRVERAQALLAVYDGGGMLNRAETALRVAENSYKAGAISLLELLDARRTYIDTRGSYLRTQHDFRQSIIDLFHSTGGQPK